MTRINSAIPVKNLTDEHLLAEHREIKRLPYCLGKAIESGSINRIPDQFTLGKGHVLFFLDKQLFARNRYVELFYECRRRGFEITNYGFNWNFSETFLQRYWNDYTPTEDEYKLLVERIKKRINESTKQVFHYYGKPITKKEAVDILVKVFPIYV